MTNFETCSINFTVAAIFLSAAIIILSIITEVITHHNFGVDDDQSSTPDQIQYYCHPRPPASLRARRFTFATLILLPLCTAFGYRLSYATMATPEECRFFHRDTNWPLVVVINIVPFVTACTAWLRTVVDCILAKFGIGLGYPLSHDRRKGTIWWPVCGVLGMAIVLVCKADGVIRGAIERQITGKTRDEMEEEKLAEEGLGGERANLFEETDEECEMGDELVDGPPPYQL